MMGLFRKKHALGEPPAPAAPVKEVEEPAAPATPPAAAPDYEAWTPEGPAAPVSPGGGEELAPQFVEAAPEAADSLPTPPGLSADHPLAGQIARALSSVYDPEIPVDIYQLGLVYDVDLNERNDVRIQMTLTAPGCPVAGSMPGMVEHAVATMVGGVGDVEVELVWDPPWTPDMMSDAARLELGLL